MEQLKKRKKVLAVFCIFLVFMWLCTLISKSIYASKLPQVTTKKPQKMAINHDVKAEGIVEEGRELAVNTESGLRVRTVYAHVGDQVEVGTLLFDLDTEDLQEIIQEKELQIRKQQLQLQDLEQNKALTEAQKQTGINRANEDYNRNITTANTTINRANEDLGKAQDALNKHRNERVDITPDGTRDAAWRAYEEWLIKGQTLSGAAQDAQTAYEDALKNKEVKQAVLDALRAQKENQGGQSSEEGPDTPGTTPSGDSQDTPGTAPGEDPDTPGTTPGDGQNTPGTTPGDGQNTPGTTPGEGQSTPGTMPGDSQSTPGTTPGDSQSTPGTTPGDGQNTPGTTPGDGQNTPGTTPGEGQSTPDTTPGEDPSTPDTALSGEPQGVSGTTSGEGQSTPETAPSAIGWSMPDAAPSGEVRNASGAALQDNKGQTVQLNRMQSERSGEVRKTAKAAEAQKSLPAGERSRESGSCRLPVLFGSGEIGAARLLANDLEESIKQAERELEEASSQVRQTKQALEAAEKALQEHMNNAVAQPDFSGEDAQQKSWASTEDALKENINSAERGVQDAFGTKSTGDVQGKRTIEDASAPSAADSSLEIGRLELENQQKQLSDYQKILKNNGQVLAETAGVVTAVRVSSGERTQDGAAVTYADLTSPLQFLVNLTKEQKKYVNQDDTATLSLGNKRGGDVNVDYVAENDNSPGTYQAIINLEEGVGTIGQSGTLEVEAQSENYGCCVPMDAVHEENGRNYVFVVGEKESILGKELAAEKLFVTILDKNGKYAAIEEGVIDSDTEVIVSASDAFEDRDVIRFKE